MSLFARVFLSIVLVFFTCLKEQFHIFDDDNLLERINKRTLFFSLGFNPEHFLKDERKEKQSQTFLSNEPHSQSAEEWPEEKQTDDLKGVGFLGDMDKESSTKEPSQTPAKVDEPTLSNSPPFLDAKISQCETLPQPIISNGDLTLDSLSHKENTTDVQINEKCQELKLHDISAAIDLPDTFKGEDPSESTFIESDSAPDALPQQKSREPEVSINKRHQEPLPDGPSALPDCELKKCPANEVDPLLKGSGTQDLATTSSAPKIKPPTHKESQPSKISAQEPSQAPAKVDEPTLSNSPPFLDEKISQCETLPQPIISNGDLTLDSLSHKENTTDVQINEKCQELKLHDMSAAIDLPDTFKGEDPSESTFIEPDSAPDALPQQKSREPEVSINKRHQEPLPDGPSALPDCELKKCPANEVDPLLKGSGTQDLATTSSAPKIKPPTHDEKIIADQDFNEEAAASSTSLLEACSNLKQANTWEEDSSRRLTKLRAMDLSGILVMHFQTMVQISQLLNKKAWDVPCNPCEEPLRKNTLSFQAMGSYFNQNKERNLLGFTSQIYGTTLGIEHAFSNRWRGKGAVGYSYSKLDWDKERGKAFLHSIYFGGLFGYFGEKGYVQSHILGARTLYRVQSDLYCQNIFSRHWGWDLSAGLSGGVPIHLKKFLLIPEVELTCLSSFEKRYGKQDSLSIHRNYASLLHQEVSLRVTRRFLVKEFYVSPSLRTGYARDSFLNHYRYTFYLQEKRTIKGFHKSMNFFILEMLAAFSYHSCLQLNVGYEAKLGTHSQLHEGKVGLLWNF